jgi:hypothetical protein
MPPPGGARSSLVTVAAGYAQNVTFGNGGIFGPGVPLAPVSPEELRVWDYPVGVNYTYTPRAQEPITFAALRALADNHDITRLAIETRKDQIEKLEWAIVPRDEKNPPKDADARIAILTEFWRFPDGERDFATWLRESLEDMLVLDAPAFEIRRNRGGEVIGLDIVDGSTINVLIDETGRQPKPPAPAFEQVIHGRPWKLLTTDALLYLPRNPRPHKRFGYSPVEQIVMTVNIALRRQLQQLQHFTEGNVPPGLLNAPDGWNVDQIRQFQEWFDSVLAGNTAARNRLVWGPAGSKYQAFKEAPLKDEQDEWLARVVCYAFSLPPTAFVKMVNRSTSETMQEASLQEGLSPLMRWVQRLAGAVHRMMDSDDLEFQWQQDDAISQQEQATVLSIYVEKGIYKVNEARDSLGLEPDPNGDELMVYTGSGPVLLSTVINPPEPIVSSPEPAKPGLITGTPDTEASKVAEATFRQDAHPDRSFSRSQHRIDDRSRALIDAEAEHLLRRTRAGRVSADRPAPGAAQSA